MTIEHSRLPMIIQTLKFLIQHVDVGKGELKINRTDNSVQSTSQVVNVSKLKGLHSGVWLPQLC